VGSVTSRVHTGTEPPVGSGAIPQKHEKYTENLIECHIFHSVQIKNFPACSNFEGDVPLFALPYTSLTILSRCAGCMVLYCAFTASPAWKYFSHRWCVDGRSADHDSRISVDECSPEMQ